MSSISDQVHRELRDENYANAQRERSRRQTLMIATVIILAGMLSILPFMILGWTQRKELPITQQDFGNLLNVSRVHPDVHVFSRDESIKKYERVDGATVVRYRCRGKIALEQPIQIDSTFEYYSSIEEAKVGFAAGVQHLTQRYRDSIDRAINFSPGASQEFLAELKSSDVGENGVVGCLRLKDQVVTFKITPHDGNDFQFLKDYVESFVFDSGAF